MWWPPNESVGGLLSLTSFLVSSGLVMFNFFSAISHGPGYLPLGWTPVCSDLCFSQMNIYTLNI